MPNLKLYPADESLVRRQPFLGQGMHTVSHQMEAASKQTQCLGAWTKGGTDVAKGGRQQRPQAEQREGQTTSFTWLEWAGGEVWRRRRPMNVNVG
ncbi:hypothetical protein M5D96_007901 [Drosophila gunungcola]|uniref:Uncharacterized protein n=1 Tax=Drosophila gunungcola TaxID=103775 RepID=A0A9Q0BPN0_9MUSC|nr:hypothetical protein M5D96_007901 [Drosophila gunungcola]